MGDVHVCVRTCTHVCLNDGAQFLFALISGSLREAMCKMSFSYKQFV